MCWRDCKVQVDVAVLDFAKAFDTVPHESPQGKLDHYGVNGNLNTWIRAFLTSRTQRVMVDGEFCERGFSSAAIYCPGAVAIFVAY